MKDHSIKETPKNQRFLRGSLLLGFASLIWGAAFVAQQNGGDALGPYTFNSFRFIMGGIVLLPLIVLMKRSFSAPLIKSGVIIGISLALASNLQQLGITVGHEAGKAGFLTSCYIVLVPVAGLFFGKKCPLRVWIAVFITAFGLYLLCIKDSFSLKLSDTLILLSAMAFTLQIMLIEHYAASYDPVALSCVEFLTCGILTLIPSTVFEIIPQPTAITAALHDPDAWYALLFSGLLSTGVAYTLQIVGQASVPAAIASLIMSLEAVFAVIAGWFFLGQGLTAREAAGCLVMFFAIILAQSDIGGLSFERKGK